MKRPITYLFVLIALLAHFQGYAQESQKPVFISLGRWCIPALFFRHYQLREAAYPFDWMITGTPFSNLYKVIENDFKDYGLKENLSIDPNDPKQVIDSKTGFMFAHDFPVVDKISYHVVPNFIESYDAVMDKYHRRIQRFRDTLSSSRPVIFIRIDLKGEGTKEQAISLRDLLISRYPNLHFSYIQLGFTEEHKTPWNQDRIYNYYLDESTAEHYDSPEWKAVIKGIEAIAQCPITELAHAQPADRDN